MLHLQTNPDDNRIYKTLDRFYYTQTEISSTNRIHPIYFHLFKSHVYVINTYTDDIIHGKVPLYIIYHCKFKNHLLYFYYTYIGIKFMASIVFGIYIFLNRYYVLLHYVFMLDKINHTFSYHVDCRYIRIG